MRQRLPSRSGGNDIRGHSRQTILVRVANLLEDGRRRLRHGRLSVTHGEHAELVLNNIRDGLGVGGRARAAAPYCVVDLREFVGYSVGNIRAGRGSGVGA